MPLFEHVHAYHSIIEHVWRIHLAGAGIIPNDFHIQRTLMGRIKLEKALSQQMA